MTQTAVYDRIQATKHARKIFIQACTIDNLKKEITISKRKLLLVNILIILFYNEVRTTPEYDTGDRQQDDVNVSEKGNGFLLQFHWDLIRKSGE